MSEAVRELSFSAAIQEALAQAMEADPRVFLMGEDIGVYGGAFQVTGDLVHRFGEDRVRDTPIAELGGAGVAVGAAVAGSRPVYEFQFSDFSLLASEQIINQAAKMRYMLGGKASVPSTPEDAKGMILAAIEDPDPVLVFEHKLLYKVKGPVPEAMYRTPIGKAVVRREGKHVTVVAAAIMVQKALEAAEILAGEGIDIEVIDLRSIRPIDTATIIESVKKTSRLACVYEGVKTLGIGAEISARIAESEAFDYLDAPILRLGGSESPIPYSPILEKAAVPQTDGIVASLRDLVKGRI
jgi:pyruvate dehydrogenase E1 component beta subunit